MIIPLFPLESGLFPGGLISLRIFDELEINPNQPFIEIKEIKDNSTFLAKKTKMYDEEKNVANKAPVDSISINDLNSSNKKKKIVNIKTNISVTPTPII